ncbi:MAG: hypothetical protein NT036_00430 [Candidatus Omnitrophica bacterium]|nr:hypothetical protein [Candidatus Omnitrophota bacterium]
MMVSTLVYAAIGYILPFLIMMSERQKDGSDPSDSYIKLNYPDIWKKLHPLGGRSWNGFELKAFLNDKYDNLSDNKLQEIKKGLKEFLHFQWAAILSWPIFWISISIINCIKNACLK